MGDSIATNAFMLGFAFQKGAIPLSLEAILRAIEINGAAIEMNKQAFAWGRLAAHDIARVRSVTQFRARGCDHDPHARRDPLPIAANFLTDYQDKAYADRYLATIAKVRKAEAAVSPASTELTEAVAKNLFKLMAYKDEYEVARLYADDSFAKKLGEKFEGDFRLKFHLAPPMFARRDKATGHLQKKEYGGWMMPRLPAAGATEIPARHGVGSIRPHGGAPDRAKADRGLSCDDRAAHLTASRPNRFRCSQDWRACPK